jgi:hypothetical protein
MMKTQYSTKQPTITPRELLQGPAAEQGCPSWRSNFLPSLMYAKMGQQFLYEFHFTKKTLIQEYVEYKLIDYLYTSLTPYLLSLMVP